MAEIAHSPTRGRRRFFAVAGVLAAAVTLGFGARLYQQHHRYKHFAVHEPGKVYRSAWVDPDVFSEIIRREKIRTVVNLCAPMELIERRQPQRDAVGRAGANLIELTFPPNNTWDTDDHSIREMADILDEPANYPIWIHCQHGRERTVKALAMYDIRRRNMTAQDSLATMPLFGIQHPWPTVTFAFNYESLMAEQKEAAAKAAQRSKAAHSQAAAGQQHSAKR